MIGGFMSFDHYEGEAYQDWGLLSQEERQYKELQENNKSEPVEDSL